MRESVGFGEKFSIDFSWEFMREREDGRKGERKQIYIVGEDLGNSILMIYYFRDI